MSSRVLFSAYRVPFGVASTVVQQFTIDAVKCLAPARSLHAATACVVSSPSAVAGGHAITLSRTLSLYSVQHQHSQEQPQLPHEQPHEQPQEQPPTNGSAIPHFRRSSVRHPLADKISTLKEQSQSYRLPHPVWSEEELNSVEITHTPPEKAVDRAAYYAVKTLRTMFDIFSGYTWGKIMGTLDEKKWLTRIIYLETVAGVPGMIGAMVRHFKSLRRMTRDHGWIHTLLEEAENERMHLMTALELRRPGGLFKVGVIGTQGVFVTMFWIAYFFSPRFCHKFVGYLEEEAVKTYTHCIECIDNGSLKMWAQMRAPPIAVTYWRLPEGAMMRDTILAIRADEAHHRVVNHTFGSMKESDTNPYGPGR